MKTCQKCGNQYGDEQSFCGYDGMPLARGTATDPLIGHVLDGRYRLTRRIGAGGFGLVYEAKHERLPMTVAVKLMLPSRRDDPSIVHRFLTEAATQALIQHPNVARIFDHGHDAVHGDFAVMEHLVGLDLAQQLDRYKSLGIVEIFEVLTQTAAALQAVHEVGRVHGDVKAENLFLADDRSRPGGFCVKLLDFGLVRASSPMEQTRPVNKARQRATETITYGSPATLPPEVVSGGAIDRRADVYSLGAVAYELLTGQILFAGDDLGDVLYHIVHDAPPRLSSVHGGTWVPAELEALVLQMLAKSPANRPASMAEVAAAFERLRGQAEQAWACAFLRKGRAMVRGDAGPSMMTDAPRRSRPLVLAVDDDPMSRRMVERLVVAAGWACESRDSAASALNWMHDNAPPDLVLTDLLMPGINGLTLAATLRAEGFQGPVVFCTSVANEALRGEMEKVGASWCLDKLTEMHRVPQVLRLSETALYR